MEGSAPGAVLVEATSDDRARQRVGAATSNRAYGPLSCRQSSPGITRRMNSWKSGTVNAVCP